MTQKPGFSVCNRILDTAILPPGISFPLISANKGCKFVKKTHLPIASHHRMAGTGIYNVNLLLRQKH